MAGWVWGAGLFREKCTKTLTELPPVLNNTLEETPQPEPEVADAAAAEEAWPAEEEVQSGAAQEGLVEEEAEEKAPV